MGSTQTAFSVYATYARGTVPRAYLVTMNRASKPPQLLRALEVKLTALPDHTTYQLSEDKYGCEIVVRPDTIVYVALSLAQVYSDERSSLLELLGIIAVKNWEEIEDVKPHISSMANAIDGSPALMGEAIACFNNRSVRVACRRHSGDYLNKQANNFSFIKSKFLNP